jgi:hypothetical protein
MAVERTLLPALTERGYAGHFTVTADGCGYGEWNSWPGLNSWEMAGAYLLLDRIRTVKDFHRFVRASQRADGNIPFAISLASDVRDQIARNGRSDFRYPEDAFHYPDRDGNLREWVGLYKHWEPHDPLTSLAALCHILLTAEISDADGSAGWLEESLGSALRAGEYLLTRRSPEGFVGGAGFYVELPSRWAWDGTTQCYAVEAFRRLSGLCRVVGRETDADRWRDRSMDLAARFREMFWTGRHFAEYLHPEKGFVDGRRLTDVDLAAVAFDVASPRQADLVWEQVRADDSLWHGDMPTRLTSYPFAYEDWELLDRFPPELAAWGWNDRTRDAAGMGRVWYVDMQAALRRGDHRRIVDAVRRVCFRGKRDGWLWHERYRAEPDGTASAVGPAGYCEYAAILVRTVLGNPGIFERAGGTP